MSRALQLAARDSYWEVQDGALDIFLAPAPGVRERLQPLVSLERGTLVGGLGPTPSGRFQLGRPALGASVRELTLDEVAARPAAAAALTPWLTGLLAAGHHEAPPRSFVSIRAGETAALAAGESLRTVDELALIVVRTGVVLLHGQADTALAPGEAALLRPADWVTADADGDLEAHDLATELAGGGWLRVGALAARALAEAERRILVAAAGEETRLQRRRALDDRAQTLPDRVLAALLGNEEPAFQETAGGDAMFIAASAVGRASGIELVRPRPSSVSSRTAPLQAIAQASRIRVRPVRLEGSWWKEAPEPMIGELAGDGRPVALLPRRGGIDLVDPAGGGPVRMTAERAATLAPRAQVLFRSLPERVLTAGDVARFAARGTRGTVIRLLLVGVAVAAIGLLVPILTGTILGTLVPRAQTSLITDLCLLLLAVAVASGLLTISQNLILLRLQGRLDALLQAAVWDRLISLPGAFFRGRSVGSIATSVLSISAAREVLASAGIQTAFAFIVGLANLGLIFFFSLALGLVTLVVVGVAVAVAAVANVVQARRQRVAFEASQRLNAKTFELVRGVAKLRAAAAEDRAFAQWAPAFAAHRQATLAARVAQNRLTVFNAALTLGGTMALFLFADRVVDIEIASFLVVYAAFAQVLGSAVLVSNTLASVVTVVPYLEGLAPIVQTEPEVGASQDDPGDLAGEIEINHVTFRYTPEGPAALDDVSFRAAAGEFVAIVGPSGSGKSTLQRILLGFDAPESGSVLYDGHDLAGLDVGSVRRQCGVVLQDGELFAGDLASNIGGSGAYTHDEILEAARLAGLEDDLAAMPLGLSTIVSEGAATLSGGQRQRLMIARALIGRPRILFFDEATSALDNRTQEVVTESTRALNATRIVIAHRLSTVMDADRIVVIDGGRVVQSGTFSELSAQEGLFSRLAARQVA